MVLHNGTPYREPVPNMDISRAVFLILVLVVTGVFYRATRSKHAFDIMDALMTDGRADHTKIGYFIAVLTMTWVMFHYALSYQLTEWMVTAYGGITVLAVLGYKGLRVGQNVLDSRNADPGADPSAKKSND